MSENGTIRKFSIFNPCDLVYMESWLQDMAADGLVVSRIGRFRTEFKVSRPAKMRYRVIPRDRSEMSDAEIDLFEGSGWHLVDFAGSAAQDWTVLGTDDEDAPEPFTDEDSYDSYVKKARRRTAINVFLTIALAAAYMYYYFRASFGNASSSLLYLVSIRAYAAFGLAVLCMMVSWGFEAARYMRSVHALGRGLPENHNVHYKGFARIIRLVNAVRLALLIIAIVLLAAVLVQEEAYVPNSVSESLEMDIGRMVGIQNFDPKAWEKGRELLTDSPESTDDADFGFEYGREYASYRVEDEGKWAMPTDLSQEFGIYQVKYDAVNQDDLQDYYVWYFERITELRSEKQAEEYLQSEIEHEYGFVTGDKMPEMFMEDIQFRCDGADYAGFYDCSKLDTSKMEAEGYILTTKPQTLYLRQGKWIIEVQYEGDRDLRDGLTLYCNKLQSLCGTDSED